MTWAWVIVALILGITGLAVLNSAVDSWIDHLERMDDLARDQFVAGRR